MRCGAIDAFGKTLTKTTHRKEVSSVEEVDRGPLVSAEGIILSDMMIRVVCVCYLCEVCVCVLTW